MSHNLTLTVRHGLGLNRWAAEIAASNLLVRFGSAMPSYAILCLQLLVTITGLYIQPIYVTTANQGQL